MLTEERRVVISRGKKKIMTKEEHEGNFWCDGNILYLDVVVTWMYTDVEIQ